MHYSSLAGLNKQVSRIGLGTVKLGRDQQVKYPNSFTIPNDKQALALFNCAAELGINLIDTAPAYGNSEERLGKLLPQTGQDWMIVSKAGEEFVDGQSRFDFRPEAITSSVERSLKRLGREAIDLLLLHSEGDDQAIIEKWGAFECLNELKKQGKILAAGMSAKSLEGALLTLSMSDVLMYELPENPNDLESIAACAHKHNSQILIKKIFASGHMVESSSRQQVIAERLHAGLSFPEVASIIIGSIDQQHVIENVEIADCCRAR